MRPLPPPLVLPLPHPRSPESVGDWIGLVILVGCIAAVFLARKRSQRAQSSALAAVHLEGFEAGRAAVLASIGSTVVVNNQLGNGTAGFDAAAAITDEHEFGDLAPNGGTDRRPRSASVFLLMFILGISTATLVLYVLRR